MVKIVPLPQAQLLPLSPHTFKQSPALSLSLQYVDVEQILKSFPQAQSFYPIAQASLQ
jgi:hypothetical protein